MAGILDFMGTGIEDPRFQATNALAQSLLGRGGGLQRLAGGLGNYGSVMEVLKNQELKRKLAEAQIAETEAQAENRRQLSIAAARRLEQEQAVRDAFSKAYRSPEQQAMGALGGPTNAAAEAAPKLSPQWDQQALIRELIKADPMQAYQMSQPKADELMSVAPGATVFNKTSKQTVFTAPDKADKPPGSVQEYQFAVTQGFPGTYEQWSTQQKRAGASNVSVKVDNKLGEGVAAQVGPMVAASYNSAAGAHQSIVNSDNLIKAVESGKVYTGPGATFRLFGAQVGQTLGVGGTDTAESIRNTRAAIQGLAQATVSARGQLKGQGQVSDFEGKLLEKASSGNVDDMTANEIKQIAEVNKRLAKQLVEQHNNVIGKLKANDVTAPLATMFELPPQSAVMVYNPATKKIERQ
jgi:hypothetical protein